MTILPSAEGVQTGGEYAGDGADDVRIDLVGPFYDFGRSAVFHAVKLTVGEVFRFGDPGSAVHQAERGAVDRLMGKNGVDALFVGHGRPPENFELTTDKVGVLYDIRFGVSRGKRSFSGLSEEKRPRRPGKFDSANSGPYIISQQFRDIIKRNVGFRESAVSMKKKSLRPSLPRRPRSSRAARSGSRGPASGTGRTRTAWRRRISAVSPCRAASAPARTVTDTTVWRNPRSIGLSPAACRRGFLPRTGTGLRTP